MTAANRRDRAGNPARVMSAPVPTDPFVPPDPSARPRQQQNLPPGVALPPANDWRSDRPGDLGPGQPEGALLGRPGPNVGYAYTLAQRAKDRLRLGPYEHARRRGRRDRRSRGQTSAQFGRAPVIGDVDVRDRSPRLRRQRERRVRQGPFRARARGRSRVPPAARARRRGARCPVAHSFAAGRRRSSRGARPCPRSRLPASYRRPSRRKACWCPASLCPTTSRSCGRRSGASPRTRSRPTPRAPTKTRSTRGTRGTRGVTRASPASRSRRSSAARVAVSSRTRSASRKLRGSARRRRCSPSSRSSR